MHNIRYHIGDIPIVIISPHDGKILLKDLPKRVYKNSIITNDLNTKTIVDKISNNIFNKLNLKPYILINNVHRKYVDMNRSLEIGAELTETKSIWLKFHNKLKYIIKHSINKFGHCLILDIHGNIKTHDIIQLGYGTSIKDIDKKLVTKSSLSYLSKFYNQTNLIIGKNSFGSCIKSVDATPSYKLNNSQAIKDVAGDNFYYNGGYITRNYSKISNVDCIQIEISKNLRNLSSRVSKILSDATLDFYFKNYYPILISN